MASTPPDRKLYLGPRLRVLRRELGINQTRMAEELGVSPSYLNHLERNQRPLTAQMLLRLAETYDIDIRDFVSGAANAEDRVTLLETLNDPLVRDIGIARDEVLELAENYPAVAEALVRFHAALNDLRRGPDLVDQLAASRAIAAPVDWLGRFLTARRNHFPAIESAMEALCPDSDPDPAKRAMAIRAALEAQGIEVRIMPAAVLGDALRHYDFHRRRLMLAERMSGPSRTFAIAYQLAMLAAPEAFDEIIARAAPPDAETRGILKIALGHYAAAALLMPYERFHAAAETNRYDLDTLQGLFGTSLEQTAQRLTTLDQTGARGVPFFLLRLDRAGNVSKRFPGSEGGALAQAGEACPRWATQEARAGQRVAQWVEMPDESRFFTLTRLLDGPDHGRQGGPRLLTLGCEARHAPRLAAADGSDPTQATTVGPGCRLCERSNCPDRAIPPITRSIEPSSYHRSTSAYPFRPV